MIIELSQVGMRIQTPNTWEKYLHNIFSLYVYNSCTKKNGELYGIGFYHKKINSCTEWIQQEPCSSNIRLRNKNQCVYCDIDLDVKYGVGDHIISKIELKKNDIKKG